MNLRADLEAAVVRGAAQQLLAALGSSAVQAPGWPARRAARAAHLSARQRRREAGRQGAQGSRLAGGG